MTLLRKMIEKTFSYTGSKKLKADFDHFDQYLPKFVKVISPAYKAIL
jgi:glutamate synthase domain-containing protein 3